MSDHFSSHADQYVQHRPHYPAKLFEYLASLCTSRNNVWDCATGNGQAAYQLAQHFDTVYASDISLPQLQHGIAKDNIHYLQAHAEKSPFKNQQFDLITVAQALHWFDIPAFFQEAKRVLLPSGCIAVWCYELCECSPAVDEIVQHYYDTIIHQDWPPERHYIEQAYQNIAFPFEEIIPTPFAMEVTWTFKQYLAYLNTWSGTQRYLKRTGNNPLTLIEKSLQQAWPQTEQQQIRWPLHFRIGYMPAANQATNL